MVQRQEPAETINLDLIFLSRELVFQGTISKAKHRRSVFVAGTEYFGATAHDSANYITLSYPAHSFT